MNIFTSRIVKKKKLSDRRILDLAYSKSLNVLALLSDSHLTLFSVNTSLEIVQLHSFSVQTYFSAPEMRFVENVVSIRESIEEDTFWTIFEISNNQVSRTTFTYTTPHSYYTIFPKIQTIAFSSPSLGTNFYNWSQKTISGYSDHLYLYADDSHIIHATKRETSLLNNLEERLWDIYIKNLSEGQ